MTCHFSAGNKLNNNRATINKITICLLINKREILISELNTCVYQYFICWAWMKNYDMDCYCNFFLSILHQRRYHPNCTKVCTCRVLGNLLHFMLRGSLKKPWVNMTRKHPPQVWSNYIPRKSSVKKHSPLIDGSIYMYINVTYNVQNTLNFQIPRKWISPYWFTVYETWTILVPNII